MMHRYQTRQGNPLAVIKHKSRRAVVQAVSLRFLRRKSAVSIPLLGDFKIYPSPTPAPAPDPVPHPTADLMGSQGTTCTFFSFSPMTHDAMVHD